MVKKFEIIELKVDKIVNGGEGLGYYNDFQYLFLCLFLEMY